MRFLIHVSLYNWQTCIFFCKLCMSVLWKRRVFLICTGTLCFHTSFWVFVLAEHFDFSGLTHNLWHRFLYFSFFHSSLFFCGHAFQRLLLVSLEVRGVTVSLEVRGRWGGMGEGVAEGVGGGVEVVHNLSISLWLFTNSLWCCCLFRHDLLTFLCSLSDKSLIDLIFPPFFRF